MHVIPLEARALLSVASAPGSPGGNNNADAELIEPMAQKPAQIANVIGFALLDGSENELRKLADGDTVDLKFYRDKGIEVFKFQALTGGKISTVNIAVDGGTPKVEGSYKYATDRAPLAVGEHTIWADAFGPEGSGPDKTIRITVIDSADQPDPPDPPQPPTVVVKGARLMKNGVEIGPLGGNRYTSDQLLSTRADIIIEGTPASVSLKLMSGTIIVRDMGTQLDAPFDWALPVMQDGDYTLVVSIPGIEPAFIGFEVGGEVQPPDDSEWAIGPRLDRAISDLTIDGWQVDAGGLNYAWWMEDSKRITARNFILRGNDKEATARFSTLKNLYNEDILLEDGEIWSHQATAEYLAGGNNTNMPKGSLVLQSVRRATVRRVDFYGVAVGTGPLLHYDYMKNIVTSDILVTDCDFYPDLRAPRRGSRFEIDTGSTRITYDNIRLHDVGEVANGTAFVNLGGHADSMGTRSVGDVTLSAMKGTLRVKGNPIIADWGGRVTGKLTLANNDIRHSAETVVATHKQPPLWFPKGWKAELGWTSTNNVWALNGQQYAANVGGVYLTPAQWNALPGVSGDTFVA
jgi:hypothetical protein